MRRAHPSNTAAAAPVWVLALLAFFGGTGGPMGCAGGKAEPDDADGDGYSEANGDCDDASAAIGPEASELCDGVDQDCDGVVDEEATDLSTGYADADGDGYGDVTTAVIACDPPGVPSGDDCDDTAATVHPGAAETCNDSLDSDCDGQDDDGGACRAGGEGWLDDVAAGFIAATPAEDEGLVYGLARGDVDGGGQEDLIAGQVGRADGIAAFVFMGERSLPSEDVGAQVVIRSITPGDGAGQAVAWLIGEDGQDTLVVGAPGTDSIDGQGSVWVVDGPLTGDRTLRTGSGIDHADSSMAFDETGASLAIADLDGDGVDEIWAGSPGFSPGGAVRRLDRHAGTWDWTPCVYIRNTGGERFGAALAPAGDVDGDGLEDLLVGAPGARLSTGSGEVRGFATVLAGNSSCTEAADAAAVSARLFGSVQDGLAGAVVAGVDDFDGDGAPELAISQLGTGEESDSHVWLVPASAALTTSATFEIADIATMDMRGDMPGWHTGSGLAAGDLDGDGATDLAFSMPVPVMAGEKEVLPATVALFYGPNLSAGRYAGAADASYIAGCLPSRTLGVPLLAPLDRAGVPTLVIPSGCDTPRDLQETRRGLYFVQPGPPIP